MASQENQEHSASTTNHQNGEGLSLSARGKLTGNSRVGGRGSSRGFGSRNRGNGGGRGGRGGSHKQKEVGRAEWAYVDQTISSSPSGLINEVVLQVIDEHATMSKLQNDKR